ncbi:flagellar basal body P-ring formation chaperone FlgA [Thalassospira mesophila]|uniref:flagellar basal body P-ring formation chaperone FlgA n=1 Tax=Thalassospira mesophila TaxID=1293891 RepID=UPI000A1ECA63|nr:flagellar basal body P-ring formation chaperone FlgA [Thalassospira mesophila]
MIIRNIIVAITLALFFVFPAPSRAQDMDILLRPQAHIEGAYVTLGDIFSGLPIDQETVAVAHAPQPGQQAVLDYRWLAGIAQRYKVAWRPRTTADQIIITRDSQSIGMDEISDVIHGALQENGIAPPFSVDMGGDTFRIELPVDAPAQIEVTGININRRTGRFIADVTTGRGSAQQRTYRMSGRYFPLEQVPVLVDPVRRGDIVRPDQVELQEVRSDRLQANVLRNPSDVIGKEVRRNVGPGEPLLNRDFTAPILVKRGAIVNIRLETPNMSLTARGKSLENGSVGDVIRVVNLQSNKTIQVEVTAENEVRALPSMSQ